MELVNFLYNRIKTCLWVLDTDIWETSCGGTFFFDSGTPEENNAKFCPFCGRHLVAKIDDRPFHPYY